MIPFRAALFLAGASLAWPVLAQAQNAGADNSQVETADVAGDDYHNTIVVTATGLKRLDVLAGTSVMSGQELQRNLAGQVGDVLKGLPGVSATSFSPGASRPVLRGFQGDRVRVLVDGIGSIDASNTSADHAVTIDPLTAERIEVLRGPAVLLYGSSAIGGAVNVIDKRIPRRVGDEPVHFDGLAEIDSATDLRATGASIDAPLSGDWALHVDGSWRKTDDVDLAGYRIAAPMRAQLLAEAATLPEGANQALETAANARGTLPNSATETKSYGAGLAYVGGGGGNLGVSVGRYETDYGVPTLPGGEGNVAIGMRQTRLDLRGALDLGGFFEQATTRWGWSDYTHTEFEDGTPGTVFKVNGLEGRLELAQADHGGWRGSLGGQFMRRDLAVNGTEAFLPENLTEQWSLFGLQEVERGPITVQFGGRFETTSVSAPNYDRTYDTVSGALGLGYDLGALRIGINGTRTERAPSAEELLANGPHPATQQYEIGDPALRSEGAWGIEGYLRGRLGPAQVELALYRNWFGDFVYLAANGAVEDGLPVYIQRQAGADWSGAELGASMPLYRVVAFKIVGDLKASYVRATLDNGEPVPRIPPLSLTGGLEYQSDAFDVRGEIEWADRQDRIAPNETSTAGYTTANLSVAWKPIHGNDNVTVMLKGDNLFDVTRRVHASFTKDFVPLPGRNVALSVKVSL